MTIEYLKRKITVAGRSSDEDLAVVQNLVHEILDNVKRRGEEAVRDYSSKFDNWSPPSFKLSAEDIAEAGENVPQDLKKDILFLKAQVENFAREQKKTLVDFEIETLPGVFLGQKYIPIRSLGVYVPGGRYSLIASSIMSVVPAKVAGVERIVACAPVPRTVDSSSRKLNPVVTFALHASGADEIFSIGGAQAIGAMTFGIGPLLEPVDMIAGPGNKFVLEAKRQVFGAVGIDLLAGPTEIGIIADESSDARIVSRDLIGQAEHDPDSPQVLITMSRELAMQVEKEIEEELRDLSTAEVARKAWGSNGEIVLVSSPDEALLVANRYAPEHLEVQTKDPEWFLQRLRNYGSLFLGEESTVAYSDKAIGTNHILPTGGASRYTGGLWIGKYMKNVTYQRLTREGSLLIGPYAARIAHAEGMIAHEKSVDARMNKYSKSRQ